VRTTPVTITALGTKSADSSDEIVTVRRLTLD
jgi:hypothetical protein